MLSSFGRGTPRRIREVDASRQAIHHSGVAQHQPVPCQVNSGREATGADDPDGHEHGAEAYGEFRTSMGCNRADGARKLEPGHAWRLLTAGRDGLYLAPGDVNY